MTTRVALTTLDEFRPSREYRFAPGVDVVALICLRPRVPTRDGDGTTADHSAAEQRKNGENADTVIVPPR